MNQISPYTVWAFWPTSPLVPEPNLVPGNAGLSPLPTPYWLSGLDGVGDPRTARKKAAKLRAIAARLIAKGGKLRLKRAARLKARAAKIERAAGIATPRKDFIHLSSDKKINIHAKGLAKEDDGDGEDAATDEEVAAAEMDTASDDPELQAEPSVVSSGLVPGVSNTTLAVASGVVVATALTVYLVRRRAASASASSKA